MAENAPRSITATLWPIADLAPLGEGIVWVEVGYDGRLYVLQRTSPGQVRVTVIHDDAVAHAVDLVPTGVDMHYAQPLPGDRLLTVAARANRGEANGFVYDAIDGRILDRFPLGDAIARVQTAADGVIWTSYSYEGVISNNPVSRNGLVAWDSRGVLLYAYHGGMAECYALNVASTHETWLYYYTDFPLVRVRDRQSETTSWMPGVAYSHGFAVGDGCALFQSSYHDSATYYLLMLRERRKAVALARLNFVDPDGMPIVDAWPLGRGDALWLWRGASVYRVTIADAFAMMYT